MHAKSNSDDINVDGLRNKRPRFANGVPRVISSANIWPSLPQLHEVSDASTNGSDTVPSVSITAPTLPPKREPLLFSFVGYSIWLELEQHDSDLDRILRAAATDEGVLTIPCPHVTVLYGMEHLTEEEVRNRFREKIATEIEAWPRIHAKGLLCDKSFDGVDGEEMV